MDPNNQISITICGDGGCGKTSITLRLVRGAMVFEYDPTIEDSYSITRKIDGVNYHISLIDTAGQEEYRSMWAHRNLAADGFLMVYDITSYPTLSKLEYYNTMIEVEAETRLDIMNDYSTTVYMNERGKRKLEEKARKGGSIGRQTPDGRRNLMRPVKLVAGNKCDLQSSREITSKAGLEWARARNCAFMETSAKDCVNIEESLEILIRRVLESRKAGLVWAKESEGLISMEKVGRGVMWGSEDLVNSIGEQENSKSRSASGSGSGSSGSYGSGVKGDSKNGKSGSGDSAGSKSKRVTFANDIKIGSETEKKKRFWQRLSCA